MNARVRFDLGAMFAERDRRGARASLRHLREAALLVDPDGKKPARLRKDPFNSVGTITEGKEGRGRLDRSGRSMKQVALPSRSSTADTPKPRRPLPAETAPHVLAVCLGGATFNSDDATVLGAARQLGHDSFEGGVIALVPADRAYELESEEIDRIVEVAQPDQAYLPETLAAQCAAVCAQFDVPHVLLTDTDQGREVACRLAVLLDDVPALGVVTLEAETCGVLDASGATCLMRRSPWVLTVSDQLDVGTPARRGAAEVVGLSSDEDTVAPVIENLGALGVSADDIPLSEAPFVIGAGIGVSAWEDYDALAEALNAKRGGTRVVCDAGLMPRDRQIGASGQRIDADWYLALGLSGAIQHLEGIESCRFVLAVNSDPQAPILRRADKAIVTDVNAMLTATCAALSEETP